MGEGQQATVTSWLPARLAGVAAAELRTRYVDERQSLGQLATTYECSPTLIATILDYHQIPRRSPTNAPVEFSAETRTDILDSYRAGETVPVIAERLGVPRAPVRGVITEAGITRPARTVSQTSISVAQLQAGYGSGASLVELAETYDLTPSSVRRALRQAGTRMRPPGAPVADPPAARRRRLRYPALEALTTQLRHLEDQHDDRRRRTIANMIGATATALGITAPSLAAVHRAFDGPDLPEWRTVRLIAGCLDGDQHVLRSLWCAAKAEWFTRTTVVVCGFPGCEVARSDDQEPHGLQGAIQLVDDGKTLIVEFFACSRPHLQGAIAAAMNSEESAEPTA